MFVIIVSECTKKAYIKSRRIISDYLDQIGHRVWAGRITQEGLNFLYLKLKKNASKNTSISCHLTKRNSRVLLWIVGDKSNFSLKGEYVFSVSEKDYLKSDDIKTGLNLISQYASTVAAIFHDVGKMNSQFQRKIISDDKKISSDYMRHEALSAIIFFNTILDYAKKSVTELDIIKLLSDPKTLSENIKWTDDLILKGLTSKDEFASIKNIDALSKNYPILSTILFLIVSHHKLPSGGYINNNVFNVSYNKHINDTDNKELIGLNQTIDQKKYKFINDEKSKFIISLAMKFSQLHTSLKDNEIKFNNIFPITSLYSRVSLILADRYISSQKDPNSAYDENQFYANSQLIKDKKAYAQTLENHLCDVGRECNSNFRRISNIINNKDSMPVIEKHLVPDLFKISGFDVDNKFYWQDSMIKSVKTKSQENIKDKGFFGVLAAGTGSGKTRAAAKLMHALTGDLRYTLAVGLRTLTLQTGTEYIEELKLNSSDVAVMIGSDVSKKLYEQGRLEAKLSSKELGTDTDLDDLDADVFCDFNDNLSLANGSIGNDIFKMCKEKEKILLSAPIVVCTIDHIMAIADLQYGRHLVPALRVMTSDLILDEIDSYSDKDLVAIGKLIYRTALAGRKVIISSATVPSVIINAFYEAYSIGYGIYCDFFGKEKEIYSGWYCEYSDISKIKKIKDIDFFHKQQSVFVDDLCLKLSNEKVKRKADILDIHDIEEQEAFKIILEKCLYLHKEHHTESNGIKISTGAVRFNFVRTCRNFSRFLYNTEIDNNICLKTLCYHSKQFPIILDAQEKILNSLLKRKNKFAIFSHPQVLEAIKNGHKEIIIIISTTSIEEVGRDHDFDYAIAEPSSNRSIIQLAGRIKRHRNEETTLANYILLSNCIDSKNKNKSLLEKQKIRKILSEKPRTQNFSDEIWTITQAQRVEQIFDINRFLVKVDARTCIEEINDNSSLSAIIEHDKKYNLLYAKNLLAHSSLLMYTSNSLCQIADNHYKENPFREKTKEIILFKEENDLWYILDIGKQTKNLYDNRVNYKEKLKYPERSLLKESVNEIYENIKKDVYKNSKSKMLARYLMAINFQNHENKSDFKIEYHDLLGAGTKK